MDTASARCLHDRSTRLACDPVNGEMARFPRLAAMGHAQSPFPMAGTGFQPAPMPGQSNRSALSGII
jgi:hypothetical protein